MSDIEKIRQEIERHLRDYSDDTQFEIGKRRGYKNILEFIDSLPEEKPSENLEQAAKEYSERVSGRHYRDLTCGFIAGAEWQKEQDGNWLNEELMKAHLNGVITGDRIARESLPMPEDTVIFQKGVADGRRLEREDRDNDKLPQNYGD